MGTCMPPSNRVRIRPQASPTSIVKMFNGLHVLSAVLVCSTVFFDCVAPAEVPEVWDNCEDVLNEVESVKTCIRHVDFYRELADRKCHLWVDSETHDKILAAIFEKAC